MNDNCIKELILFTSANIFLNYATDTQSNSTKTSPESGEKCTESVSKLHTLYYFL